MAQLKDTVVSGDLRVTDKAIADAIQAKTINAPTSSGGTVYGPGTNGQILKSNGSTVYWAADNNTTYTPANAAPGNIATTGAVGTSANYARQDHTHGIALATGDSNGQVKIAGTNVAVKGLATLAYKESLGKADVGLGNVDNTSDANKQIYEANLLWGGKNFAGDYGCIDAAMVDELGANRLAFISPSSITVEYSRDGGSTWTDYGASNAVKTALFSQGNSFAIGKADATNKATANGANYQLRITIDTGAAPVYTVLNKFVMLVSTNGSNSCTVTIQKALQSTPTAFVDHVANVPLSGWSGYNVINVSGITTYGNQPATQYGRLRFLFKANGGNTNYTGLNILKIMGFGGVGWTTSSNMAKTGHIYSFDENQNATFPAQVTATQFNGKATTADRLAGFSGGGAATSCTWGNQTGTAIRESSTPAGGGVFWRDNNPSSGKVSMGVDGTIYINEGNTNVGDAIKTITRSGTTFTYTTLLGATGTFTQQDTNTWRGIQNVLTSDSTSDSLSAAQGKALANGSARDSTKLPLAGGTMTGDILFSDSGQTTRQIRFLVGANDYARVAAGATASNAGWMEIATADDGNEPIYVRQYTGAYTTLTRTLTLLDASGNTTLPGTLTVNNLIKSTYNGNTVTIGSQNANFTHIYNSANIPFIFNKSVLSTDGTLGDASYPFKGLYLTGDTGIHYKGSKADIRMIRFLDNTADEYGNGIAIGGGGITIVGAGESADTLANAATTVGNEVLQLGSDSNIEFYSNLNSGISSGKKMTLDTNGDLKVPRYVYGTYLNQSSGAETPTTSSYLMYANSDGFLRKSSLANVKTILGLGSAAYTASTAYAAAGHNHAYISVPAFQLKTGSTNQAKISLQTLMTWLITTKGYIPNNTNCHVVMVTDWSYAGSDILQFSAPNEFGTATNYELQLAGVTIEFEGRATSYQDGTFRLRIHSSPTISFTATSGYTQFPVDHIAEYYCNGSGYTPAWRIISNWGDNAHGIKDSKNGTVITVSYGDSGLGSSTAWLAAWNGYQLRAISPENAIKSYGIATVAETKSYLGIS